MLRLSLPVLLKLIFATNLLSEAAELSTELDKISTTESGQKWCPAPKIGVRCPESSVFHFYRCCGDTLSQCCFQVQVWVVVLLIALGVVLFSSLLLLLIRCLFCRRK
ncbi:hypothetical protein M3Y97_00834900 [Aphelenchoides bicaudatus]|nr:hypothetical protein M3Y97_00834900 [Aphelenchoides bicaudatus]